MMAYFSNGSEGEVLDELCSRCVHGFDGEKNRQERPCAAWMLQAEWNYDQHDDAAKRHALDTLIPQTRECLCAMFLAAGEPGARHTGLQHL